MTSPESQLATWNAAVTALGGKMAAARALPCNERTMRALCSGERKLHSGYLRDMAGTLVKHIGNCRKLERQLFPAYSGNLTEAQAYARAVTASQEN